MLAAWPGLPDPNFERTVLLLCGHTEDGAYGLVLNRGLELTLAQLLPDHPVASQLTTTVQLGGPVEHARLQFVHMLPGRIRGGSEICTGLWLGGDLDDLAEVLLESQEGRAPRPAVRPFLGYAGWTGGQLDRELVEGSWMPAAFDARAVFEDGGEEVWEAVVERADPERRAPESDLGDESAN